jgi:hypothetical protein
LKNFPAHQPRNLKKGNLISTTKRFKKQNKPIIICIHVCVLYYTLHTHTTLGIAGLLICLYHSLILISLIIQAHYSLFIRWSTLGHPIIITLTFRSHPRHP